MTFAEHKEITATDLETIANELSDLAAKAREGNLKPFEEYWIDGGTEEGDAKIASRRELLLIRYFHRQEKVQ